MKEEDGAMEHSFLHDKKILIVDDEPELLKMVEAILKDEGFARLVSATSQKEGIEVAKAEKPDLAILDVMLPDGDGFSLMESIRTWSDMPVIFLTARDEAMDKLAGLGLGADDYITKPFMPPEFLLRVNAVLRRCYKEDVDVLKLDGCVVDFGRAEVRKEEKILPLTAMEYRLLKTLAKNAGRIVTMDAVCEALWGDNPFGYENSLNAHIRRVREKIEKNPSTPVSLVTIKGLGYRLIVRK
nr:response regulator transcription factor [uncultured Dubosiella sp.]